MATLRGTCADLRRSYEAMERHLEKTGREARSTAWEVYLDDPAETDPKDLVTEIYMLLD
jgi:effector-binding domain-containing protein